MSLPGLSSATSKGRWTKSFFLLCTLPTVLLLMACQSQTPPLLPANLTSPCPMLPTLEDGKAGTILRNIVATSQLYYECKNKHEALVKAVTK